MTIARAFFDYQREVPTGRFQSCAPGLVSLHRALSERFDMNSLGCFGVRPIRLGEFPSTHSYGAAIDLSYRAAGRSAALEQIVPYLIGWSAEWGIQAVHDYVGSRIWRAARTPDVSEACDRWWRAQRPDSAGMGQPWADYFHIEIHPTRWADNRTEFQRLP